MTLSLRIAQAYSDASFWDEVKDEVRRLLPTLLEQEETKRAVRITKDKFAYESELAFLASVTVDGKISPSKIAEHAAATSVRYLPVIEARIDKRVAFEKVTQPVREDARIEKNRIVIPIKAVRMGKHTVEGGLIVKVSNGPEVELDLKKRRGIAEESNTSAPTTRANSDTIRILKEAVDGVLPHLEARFAANLRGTFDTITKKYGNPPNREKNFIYSRDYPNWAIVRDHAVKRVGEWQSDIRAPYEIDESKLAATANRFAKESAEVLLHKMISKVGKADSVEIRSIHKDGFVLAGYKNGIPFVIDQDSIINVSSRGKLFMQWPARIKMNGKRVSEAEFNRQME